MKHCYSLPPTWCNTLIYSLLVALSWYSQLLFAHTNPPANAVASAHALATKAGMQILANGGNAFDAAATVTAVLAVVEPYSSGLGGGGFWLLHRARDGFEVMIDGRERAPLAAHRDMYLDSDGKVIPERSVDGALAAAIPGTVAALVHLAKNYGRLPLTQSLAAAIRLAEQGFAVDEVYRQRANFRLKALQASPAAAIFLSEGQVPQRDHLLHQPDLARALRLIAREGHDGFYRGEIADQLVSGVRNAGGIWIQDDLRKYQIVERKPVYGTYRGIRLTSAAPPSSAGIMLVEMLNVLSGFSLESMDKITRTHLLVEAMRRAYRDRAQYLGDPDAVNIPLARLTSPFYAAGLRASMRTDRATPSALLSPIMSRKKQGRDTSHFSILDREGNRVAATLSINYPFGSAFVPPGSGILLNDEMDDFAAKPGSPNAYGLVGAEANAIEPGKRMLSSMAPTFLDDGRRVAILGTPGGSRIISMLLLASLDFARGGSVRTMVELPRFHHQYVPDVIQFEPDALNGTIEAGLQTLGHTIQRLDRPYGNMQAIVWDRQRNHVDAAADSRGIGVARVQWINAGSDRSSTSSAGLVHAK